MTSALAKGSGGPAGSGPLSEARQGRSTRATVPRAPACFVLSVRFLFLSTSEMVVSCRGPR